MKMPPLTTWQIYSASGLTCAIVTLCAYFFLAAPAISLHRQEREVLLEALERHREMPKLTAELNATRKQSAAVLSEIDKTRVTLAPFSALNERLAELEHVASSCGVAVDEVRPGPAVSGPHYQSLPIHLTGATRYANCVQFIERMHEVCPDIAVKTWDISSRGIAAKTPGESFRFDLVWYAKK